MRRYFGALTILILIGMILARVLIMKRPGIGAMKFGEIDKKEFLIPLFALFYFSTVFAAAFHWPLASRQEFFESQFTASGGVILCSAGWLLLLACLISFGRSFRVGIDADEPDKLVTTGIFSVSRHPIYVAFAAVLAGEFLSFANGVRLVHLITGVCLFHRQVLREEEFLRGHYGREYREYCRKVGRYLWPAVRPAAEG